MNWLLRSLKRSRHPPAVIHAENRRKPGGSKIPARVIDQLRSDSIDVVIATGRDDVLDIDGRPTAPTAVLPVELFSRELRKPNAAIWIVTDWMDDGRASMTVLPRARFELLVDRVEDGLLIATNCCDVDIPVGTRLTGLWASSVRIAGDDFERQPDGGVESVSLTIDGVEIHRRQLTEVPRGWSAGIRLVGSGMDAVQRRLSARDNFAQNADGWRIQVFLGGD